MALPKALYRAKKMCKIIGVAGSIVATGYTGNLIFKIAKVKSEIDDYERTNDSKIIFVRDSRTERRWNDTFLDMLFYDHVVSIDNVAKMRTFLQSHDDKRITWRKCIQNNQHGKNNWVT
jgi:hypothetical protein